MGQEGQKKASVVACLLLLLGILLGSSSVYWAMSNGFVAPNQYFDAIPSTAYYTVRFDGSYLYNVKWNGKIDGTPSSDLTTQINYAIVNAPSGSSIVIAENSAVLTLSDYVLLNKDINFYSYAKLKVANSFPTWKVFDVHAHNVDIYLYELDGNKANNPSQEFNAFEISGSENLRIKTHNKNFGYGDVYFKGSASEPNRNIQLQIQSENNGGVGFNAGVYLGANNDDITISGNYYNVTGNGGQVIYNTATLGIVRVRDLDVRHYNSTGSGKPVIDARANTITFIDNVEISLTTQNLALVVASTAEVYATNLRMLNIGVSGTLSAIENHGIFVGSNVKIDTATDKGIWTRGGSDWLSLTNFDIRSTTSYGIMVHSDSGGNHTVTNGQIIGAYGIADAVASASKKSAFSNVDVSGVTTDWARMNGAYGVTIIGFKFYNSGKTSAKDGESISHGLGDSPTCVIATANTAKIIVAVTAIYSTQFVVSMNWDNGTAVSTYYYIYWYVEIRP